jgi:acyl-CoA thioesterase I
MKFKAALLHVIVIAGLAVGSSTAAMAKTLQLVGFGDSLMAGYQLPQSESYTVCPALIGRCRMARTA